MFVLHDQAVSRLGIKEFLPPYVGDDLDITDLLTGVAFASGGSGYDPLTSIPSVKSIHMHLKDEVFLKFNYFKFDLKLSFC